MSLQARHPYFYGQIIDHHFNNRVYNNFRWLPIMNRKPVFYSNKHERKNVVDLSPRLPAKKAEPIK